MQGETGCEEHRHRAVGEEDADLGLGVGLGEEGESYLAGGLQNHR